MSYLPDSARNQTAPPLDALRSEGDLNLSPLRQDWARRHLDATTTVDVPTMHRTGTAGYAQFDDAEVVQLPTRDPDLGLLVVVPRGDSTLADLEAHLPQLWPTLRAPKSARVQLALPRYQVETALSLRAPLIALGMRDAFARGRADLTGIVGRKDTCVDEVVHKTYLKVYEQGIEAAAATAIVSRGAAPGRPQVVTIDRPFLFALVHAKAGALFLGRLVDPR
jgi:serpin B